MQLKGRLIHSRRINLSDWQWNLLRSQFVGTRRRGAGGLVVWAALVALGGCGGEKPDMIPIKGEVIYDGKPLAQGQVVYLPRNRETGRQASGPIKPDGTFVMTTQKGGDGVKFGEYDIVVFGYGTDPSRDKPASREEQEKSMKNKRRSSIPEKYSNQRTSGLSDTVDANHEGFKRIELKK